MSILKNIWSENKASISFIYGLNIVEEICYVLIPSAVGLLIDTFIEGKGLGIWAFAGAYLGWQGIATFRKIQDTIVFTRIFNETSLKVIRNHQEQGIETTKINARVELMKQVVEFFEIDLPFTANSLISISGSAILLYFYNPKLLLVSLMVVLPSFVFNYFYSKKIQKTTEKVNDLYEKQIDVIESGSENELVNYFKNLRRLNIRKSTLEAFNFGLLEVFVFGMIMASIYIICKTDNMNYGSIVASYGIILRFAYGFDFIPHITTKIATIRDIVSRLENPE
jgi:ABC-type bacteriocin/lantibiotic exporter with double-glycine peptidase domain